MELNMIVAASRDGAIGRRGDLIWHIPADLRHFKSLTMGHPVIMGRKTWESLPKKPLPGRMNIVVSRKTDFQAPGATVVASPQLALEAAGDGTAPFVIGGEQIYRCFLPLATRIFLTEIEADCPDADARFELPSKETGWEIEEEGLTETSPDGIPYRYVTFRRI